jgi:hypothetical protein
MYNIDHITKLADNYEQLCSSIVKEGHIKKLPDGKYRVLSEKGKNLGTSDSRSGAEKRLQQVEFFKHKDQHKVEDKKIIDLTKADEFAYSAIMRCLNQQASKEQVVEFLKMFKKEFDRAIKKGLQKPEKIALQNSLINFNKIHPIKVKRKLVKTAATSELGDPVLVGKYLADIIKFTLNRISPERRGMALAKLRTKIYHLNEQQLASKVMPPSSSMGQSITFLKHILFNHDAQYIRSVLNSVTRNMT